MKIERSTVLRSRHIGIDAAVTKTAFLRDCDGGSAKQDVLNGPHTRVRVDAAVMPTAPPMVSPQGKGKKKASAMRQMGLGNFYKGACVPSLALGVVRIKSEVQTYMKRCNLQGSLPLLCSAGCSVWVLTVQAR